jgi:hypothetical protein
LPRRTPRFCGGPGHTRFHVKKQLLALAAKNLADKNLADKSAR